jgi:hypothetical protein
MGGDGQAENPGARIESIQSAQYYTDWSGQLQTIVLDQAYGEFHAPSFAVALPSDYVLIGGGAYTDGTDPNGGGYLTASYPDWPNNTCTLHQRIMGYRISIVYMFMLSA